MAFRLAMVITYEKFQRDVANVSYHQIPNHDFPDSPDFPQYISTSTLFACAESIILVAQLLWYLAVSTATPS